MIVPIPLAGGTGGHRSTQFSAEVTRNMYLDQANGRFGVHDFPGLKPFGTAQGEDRGAHRVADTLYRVAGTTLYEVSETGSHTELGTIPGTKRVVFADDDESLYMIANGILYKHNGGTVSTPAQGVLTNLTGVAWINTSLIITGTGVNSGRRDSFAVSDPNSDTFNALNFAAAEVSGDVLLRPYVFNQLIYFFGTKSTEVWYYTGFGNPPVQRQDTSLINIGLAGPHAVTNTDSYMYWLGDDRKVYKAVGASAQRVDTPAIARIIEGISDISDCVVSDFRFEGQTFVLFTFDDWSLVYSDTLNYWITLGGDVNYPDLKWRGNQVVSCYGKNLVAADGAVFDLDLETYTDDGQTRLRIRTLPSLTGALLRKPGARIIVKMLRINMEVGVGLETGQGSDPVIMCEFSPDGGKTWQAEQFVKIGKPGQYILPVDFWDFCTGYDIRTRITCSDPIYLSMFDAAADIELDGY